MNLISVLFWMALPVAGQAADPPNVLLVIADDLGSDLVGAYDAHTAPASTPVLDYLAAEGLMFDAAYSNPVCSPTRVSIFTGAYASDHLTSPGRAHFIGAPVYWDCSESASGEFIAPLALPFTAALAPAHYRTGMVGKLHYDHSLEADGVTPNLDSAIERGWERYLGAPSGDLGRDAPLPQGSPLCEFPGYGYTRYDHVNARQGGATVVTTKTTYITTQEVDDTLHLIDAFAGEPWFITTAFHAPHRPFHIPPRELVPSLTQAEYDALDDDLDVIATGDMNLPAYAPAARRLICAMSEALDTELGRLLASIRPEDLQNLIVIFASDNGTPKPAFDPGSGTYAYNGTKGKVLDGGIRVPLIIAGAGVASSVEPLGQLVSLRDLHATILELMGVSPAPNSPSRSLVPYFTDPDLPSLRDTVYSRRHRDNGPEPTGGPFGTGYAQVREMVRDARFKLIRRKGGLAGAAAEEFFDLAADPGEADPLTAAEISADPIAQAAYDRLSVKLSLP